MKLIVVSVLSCLFLTEGLAAPTENSEAGITHGGSIVRQHSTVVAIALSTQRYWVQI